MANFAIKDCFNLTFYKLGQSTPTMTVDYLNSGSFSLESEKTVAKKKGVDSIVFAGARTGSLTLESELCSMEMLAANLGGKLTGEKIEITDVVPSDYYKVVGTFVTRDEQGVDTTRQITFHKAAFEPNSEIAFSATDIASFSFKLSLLLDSNNKLVTIEPPTQAFEAKSK
jgi:hypothetical protein